MDLTLVAAGSIIPPPTKANEQHPCARRLLHALLFLNCPTSLKRFQAPSDIVRAIVKHVKSRLITPSRSHLCALPLQTEQKHNSLQVCAMPSSPVLIWLP